VESEATKKPRAKFARVSQTDVPRHGLEEAVRVARALEDHYGGRSASPMDVATSLDSTPASSWFRMVTGAAVAYGLTDGAYNSPDIQLTDLGRRVVAPTKEGDDATALREALLRPRVMREFLQRYDRKKLPPANIAQNVLASLGVAKEATERTFEVIRESAEHAGALRTMKGDQWVDLRGASVRSGPTYAEHEAEHELDKEESAPLDAETPTAPPREAPSPKVVKPIFIGHGKKKGPLDKLEKILSSFQIPYKVAITEPNLGRPIPTKVKATIQECGSAILIFTRDEKFFDADGGEIWRPSENVVYELGAVSYEYDDRVVIFMEKGLEFPTNFQSVGHIEFEEDSIESKTMELMKELIGFGLLKVTPAS
jgi:predicted nucleotide-binding protein